MDISLLNEEDVEISSMNEDELEALINAIIEYANSEINDKEHLEYDYSWEDERRHNYWYYNNEFILELSDLEIMELLLNNDENKVIEILVDKLKGLIELEVNKKKQKDENPEFKEFAEKVLNYADLDNDDIEILYEEFYLLNKKNYLLDNGEISFSKLLADWKEAMSFCYLGYACYKRKSTNCED